MSANKLNQEIENHLLAQIKEGHISHAYILNGENVETSLKIAEDLAGNMVSSKADVLLFTHEKPNLISVDEIRTQINQTVHIKPYDSAYKVYIVPDAEKMNPQAQNALLKTLEEPPSYVVIFLITRNSESFLQTILSRCVKINIFDEDQLPLSGPDSELIDNSIKKFLQKVPTKDEKSILTFLEEIEKEKDYAKEILEKFRFWFRDALFYKATKSTKNLYFKEDSSLTKGISEKITFAGINRIVEKISQTENRIEANVNYELCFETLLQVILQEVRKEQ